MGRKRHSFLSNVSVDRFQRHPPATKCDSGQTVTIRWFSVLGEPFVGLVGMEADALLPSVIAPNSTETIAGMPNQRPALEPQRARASIGLADAALGCFQPVQLAPMEVERH